MKKITKTALFVLAATVLAACSPKTPATETPTTPATETPTTPATETPTTQAATAEPATLESPETQAHATETSTEPATEEPVADYAALTQSSDRVTKIKRISKGGSDEWLVLENLKGTLDPAQLSLSETMLENRAYLIFTVERDGKAELNGPPSMSFVLLEGDQHEMFEQINKALHGQ